MRIYTVDGLEEPPEGHQGKVEGCCPVCGDPFEGCHSPCPICETPHHPDCWRYNEGCAIYGCCASSATRRRKMLAKRIARREVGTSIARQELLYRFREATTLTTVLPGLVATALSLAMFLFTLSVGLTHYGRLARFLYYSAMASLAIGPLLFLFIPMAQMILRFSWTVLMGRSVVADRSAADLAALLKANPESADLLEALAYGLMREGHPEQACKVYRRAVALRPRQVALRYAFGKALVGLGAYEEAREAFLAVCAGQPDEGTAQRAQWWLLLIDSRVEGSATEGCILVSNEYDRVDR